MYYLFEDNEIERILKNKHSFYIYPLKKLKISKAYMQHIN